MELSLKKISLTKLKHIGIGALAAVMIAACGGGGGSPGTTIGTGTGTGTGTGASTAASITLALVDTNGQAKSSVTSGSPLVARATVVDASGQPVSNTIVTFATGGALTSLAPSSGSVATNSLGVATISIAPKDLMTAQSQAGSADTVTATATVGDQALIKKSVFSIGASAITLSLISPNNGVINLKAYDTTSIKVDVFADGVLYKSQPVTVNFSSACAGTKADLPASTSTVNGRAQVVYSDKGCGADDVVTVSVAGAPSVTATLKIAAPVAASIGFVSATPSDKAIVIQGAGGNGRTETANLTFKVLSTNGAPLPNEPINFTVTTTQPVVLQSTSAITDSNGNVSVAVNSGTLPTTFRVNAMLANSPAISTISDTVTVTTGQPIQAAFSLSVGSPNIPGWNHDNEKTNVNILLADQSGNPVADGTPVVVQTDSGAVGSSSIGGCTTINGACSVDFRSQNPRYGVGNTAGKVPGLATITVSTTSALYTLSDTVGIYLSGDDAVNVRNVATGALVSPSLTNNLVTSSCGNFSLRLSLADLNGNPMPEKTTVESANPTDVTIGEIIPAAVPKTTGSSVHTIPVKPDTTKCNVAGVSTATGTFDVKITSPLGAPKLYSFSLTYPM